MRCRRLAYSGVILITRQNENDGCERYPMDNSTLTVSPAYHIYQVNG